MNMPESKQLTVPEAIAQVQQLLQQGTPVSRRDAQALCQKVLEVDANNCNALYFLGSIDFGHGNFPAAAEHFRRGVQINPAAPAMHFLLGCSLHEMGLHSEAESALRQTLSFGPQSPEVTLTLIVVLIAQHNFSEALEHCDNVLQAAPENPQANVFRAAALFGLQRLGEAIAAGRRAIETNPADAKAHHSLASFLYQLGSVDEAEDALRKAIQLQPDFKLAYLFLGGCLRSQGKTSEAISQFETLFGLDPAFEDTAFQLAEARQLLALEDRAQDAARHLRPIFVLAPVARCGTTLLQRLFNSSNDVVMFGENEDVSRRLPECVRFAISKSEIKEDISTHGSLQEMLTQDWVAGLFPGRADEYGKRAVRNFYEAVEHYQLSAEKLGRRWGIKEPYTGQTETLRRLLPEARFVCIYRNLFDVARSYKARGWFESSYDVVKLAHDWQEEIRQLLWRGNQNILIVKYEDLVANPDQELLRIEGFCGCAAMDRGLMNVKVNLSDHNQQGQQRSSYRVPEELTGEEHDILVKYAHTMLSHLGYL